MTIQECYEAFGGDYDDIVRRLGRPDRVGRLLNMFVRDTSFQQLKEALEAEDYEQAFRAAHSLKGVTLNLSLARLARSSVEITEALRGGTPKGDVKAMFAQVQADYELTLAKINEFAAQ